MDLKTTFDPKTTKGKVAIAAVAVGGFLLYEWWRNRNANANASQTPAPDAGAMGAAVPIGAGGSPGPTGGGTGGGNGGGGGGGGGGHNCGRGYVWDPKTKKCVKAGRDHRGGSGSGVPPGGRPPGTHAGGGGKGGKGGRGGKGGKGTSPTVRPVTARPGASSTPQVVSHPASRPSIATKRQAPSKPATGVAAHNPPSTKGGPAPARPVKPTAAR